MLGVLLAAAVAAPCATPPSLLTQTRSVGQALVGDVDGDGRADRVSLRIAPRATVACGVFVVVRTGAGTSVARVRYSPKDPGTAGDLVRIDHVPFLNGLYRLDGRRR